MAAAAWTWRWLASGRNGGGRWTFLVAVVGRSVGFEADGLAAGGGAVGAARHSGAGSVSADELEAAGSFAIQISDALHDLTD